MIAALALIGKFILPALTPVLSDGLRGLFGKIFGSSGAVPQNFEQALEWEKVQVTKLQALSNLDAPGMNMSRWVQDLRGSNRYILADIIILATITSMFFATVPEAVKLELLSMVDIIFSFFFGERMYLGMKRTAR